MTRHLSAAVAFIAAAGFSGAAFAYPPEESAMLSFTGKAMVASFTQGHDAAMAICESSRASLTAQSPKYLAFYIERCLATFAETGSVNGGVDGGKRCPHYERAIAIWRATPPPLDRNDEDSAIGRARFLREIKEDYAAYCGANPPGKPKPPAATAMVVPPMADATVTTGEGISYALPAGFGVRMWDPDTGAAHLRNPVTGDDFSVMRQSSDWAVKMGALPEKETVAPGVAMEWEYVEFLPGAKSYVMHARVPLPMATISIGAGNLAAPAGIDKAAGLAALRAVAKSVKIIGPRQCIGDCKAGTVTK